MTEALQEIVDLLDLKVHLVPKEYLVKEALVAVEGHKVAKEIRGPWVHQAQRVRGARKVIWVPLVKIVSQDLQGLQGSRARPEYLALAGQ